MTSDIADALRVEVDRSLCQNYGQCVFEAPEVFDLNDSDTLVYEEHPDGGLRDKVEAAALACPVQAIRIASGAAAPA